MQIYKASDHHVVAVSRDWYMELDNLEKILIHKTLTYFNELTTKDQNMRCVRGERAEEINNITQVLTLWQQGTVTIS